MKELLNKVTDIASELIYRRKLEHGGKIKIENKEFIITIIKK